VGGGGGGCVAHYYVLRRDLFAVWSMFRVRNYPPFSSQIKSHVKY
jgi:hypothetical protein